jgi:hypothetical protein
MKSLRLKAEEQSLILLRPNPKWLRQGQNVFAERLLEMFDNDVASIAAIISISMKPAPKNNPPQLNIHLFHKPFPQIKQEHIRAPEYSFKLAPDSALLGAYVHSSLAEQSNIKSDLRLALNINPFLPDSLRTKMISIEIQSPGNLNDKQQLTIANALSLAMRKFHDSQDYTVIGILPPKALSMANAEERPFVKAYKHIYDNEPQDHYATKDEQKARAEKLKPQFIKNIDVCLSGFFAVFGLERTTPYHYEVCLPGDADDPKVLAEGDFFSPSIAGTARTATNKIDDYQPLDKSKYQPPPSPAIDKSTEFDYIIEGATIIDGSNEPRFLADVGIIGEKIRSIGDLQNFKRKQTVNARGLFLTPGFIDIHNHSDGTIGRNTRAHTYLREGVTTVLGGNCSFSQIGIGAFLQDLETSGVAINFAHLVGNRPVRVIVAGWKDRIATYDEIYRMKEIVDLAMEEGAFGMSTGLIYRGGESAYALELAELAKQVGLYGGFYASHIRDETDLVLDAAREAMFIGELAEVPVQISHMKVINRRNWGEMKKYLHYIEHARKRGIDVLGDQYPYRATGASHRYQLHYLIKRRAIDEGTPEVCMFRTLPEQFSHWEGRMLTDVMAEEGKTPQEIIDTLELTPDSKYYGVYICLSEDDLKDAMQSPLVMVCSDSSIPTARALERGNFSRYHPRTFGTYPEFFGKYVRHLRHLPRVLRQIRTRKKLLLMGTRRLQMLRSPRQAPRTR